jgi:Uncharacterized protein conserved in bacteria (DUF2188)/Protein of unknown function (DUF2442)
MAANPKKTFNEAIHRPVEVNIRDGNVYIKLAGGRTLSTPLARHPWLARATPAQLSNYELGYVSVWWPDLDDGLDIEWLLTQPLHEAHHQAARVPDRDRDGLGNNLHIVPHSSKWAVKGAGDEKVSTVHNTQKQAIEAAREIVKNGGEIIIHDKQGRIQGHVKAKPPRS